ncbi:Solute carrier family 35 member G1 [Orchesella cincta]|uniref:Solute carrier family 35 member G1 n=1 Tax=Orchesella cincta TaxID=48709 RepID=A0A1D2N3X1_ORCCI|nr:Solute carrier family 35 member G1 [Orchesella cincta]
MKYAKLEGENNGPCKEVIVFPAIGSASGKTGNNGSIQVADKGFQDAIYPQLINSARNVENANAKTPLLANKKKSIVPTKTNFFGIFLAFISGVFFTLCSGTVKYLTEVDPMELLIFRSLFQIGVTLPIALYKGQNILGPQGSRALLFAQGVVGGTTLVMLFYSFRLLPLGDAATIIFSSPVFVMIMSHIWLREPCGFYRTFIVFFLVTGVVFITKPPFLFTSPEEKETYNILGYVAALFGTIFTAINIVVMRKCKDVHFSVVVFQFSFWSLVISTCILLAGGTPAVPHQTATQWVLIVLVAVFGLSGQILVAIALAHEGAGRVAVTRSMDIVLIFNEVPDWKSIMGAFMVMICVIGMGIEDVVHRLLHKLP